VSERTFQVLVGDDHEDSALSLALVLEAAGYAVRAETSGRAVFDAATEQRPDAIFLDIGMPVLNGYEVCRLVRAEPWGANVLIVALTGRGHDDDRRKSSEAGFNHHFVKPIDPDKLISLLRAREFRG
jgi:CheY-like chemotaxis protein